MKSAFLYVPIALWLAACASNRPASSTAPADGAEYYQPNQPTYALRKQLLPDPTGGLGHAEDADIRVTDIRLTASYTVVYMTFARDPRERYAGGTSAISFNPKAVLATRDGRRTYPLRKADGIPMSPDTREVRADESLSFVLYFDRLDDDVQSFDLFECHSENGNSCFNVAGLPVPGVGASTDFR